MKKYFNINLQFNHYELEKTIIETSLNSKGYCCFVDTTLLVHTYNNDDFRSIVNKSLLNSCDGSYIPMLAGTIHNEQLKEHIGPDFFKKFIYISYTQLIIGNTVEVFHKIKAKLELNRSDSSNLFFIPLPFKEADEFDYIKISSQVNSIKPRLIWVSLGAPKQEVFMSNLLPYIDKGVMLGVGAALNYFSGEINDIPAWTKQLKVIWIYRIFTEPKKQFKRLKSIVVTFPIILRDELRKVSKFSKI